MISRAATLTLALALVGCGASDGVERTSAVEQTAESEAPEAHAEAHEEPAGCALEGEWRMTAYPGMDAVGPGGERPIGMSREYTFADGRFHMQGYPELVVDGRYEVSATGDQTATVHMSEVVFDGTPRDDESHSLTFTAGCDEFEMDRTTYVRAAP